MDRIGVSFLDPLDDYELIHRIGCGTYGDVFKARNIRTSELAAIKIVKLDSGDDITPIQQEITMMKECKHKNIVAYFGSYHRCWVFSDVWNSSDSINQTLFHSDGPTEGEADSICVQGNSPEQLQSCQTTKCTVDVLKLPLQ
ncbi:mitogen-activated protein kinase kinase kinase kinase 2-like [Neolamprologus brichardi]|uniref:mitogen-activated protein kinase kinase kinase kinase 2-like n=1 Tax=Neolamprologus brichardi TaxID=32507 RepID=UPI001643C091|nr:mitogen-activated protein kinase kinase kinase kinase 2-like [Neolamprologus brichardi]